MKKRFTLVAALAACLILAASAALAHDMWLITDNPTTDKPLRVVVGYGHAFPTTEQADMSTIMPAAIVGPQGAVATKPGKAQDFISTKPLAKGTYIVTSHNKARYYTKSPEGSKNAPKSEVPEAISCVMSAKFAKAVVNLGGVLGDVSQPVGQTLEIVPLANPGAIKAGGELPVLVLYKGKPLAGAALMATYAGFSKHHNSFAFYAKADKQGKAYVQVWHDGLWLVLAKHKVPFEDRTKCDNYSYSSALTFQIK